MINGIALFIGVESQNWTLKDFQIAAQDAKALGVSALIIKIADGAKEWYGQIGGWREVLSIIEAQGIKAIPYVYSYGNKFIALYQEIAIFMEAMDAVGIVIADMEIEWNGQYGWAQTLAQALKSRSGIFCITTWADPQMQNWQGVIEVLKPAVDVWLPQVYTNFLASVYKQQFAGLTVVPVLSLGEGFGPNDVVQHAKDAQAPALAIWEYQMATGGYAEIVREIVAMGKVTTPTVNQIQAANDSWDSVLKNMSRGRAPKGTGIYQSWLIALINGTFYGPPVTQEYSSIDWDGNPITVQEFARARCEWREGVPNWYSINGKI